MNTEHFSQLLSGWTQRTLQYITLRDHKEHFSNYSQDKHKEHFSKLLSVWTQNISVNYYQDEHKNTAVYYSQGAQRTLQ
jgi:hypothetical protein